MDDIDRYIVELMWKRWLQEIADKRYMQDKQKRGKVGRPPRLTADQINALKQQCRDHRDKPKLAEHLQRFAKSRFNLNVHIDTIRDWIIKAVDEEPAAGKLEK